MAENDQTGGQQATDAQQVEYWRQQAIAQNQQREALQQQYNADMEKVYNVLTSQQNQQPQAAPPQPEPWDVTDPTKLRENVEASMKTTMTQQMAPVVLALANNQYEAHMLNASRDERMPYFRYWENEIRQLAKSVAPGLLAEYNTIVNLYQLVQARHGQELVELEVRRRLAAQQQNAQAEEVEIDDDSEERSNTQLSQPPAAPQSPPPPTRNVPAPQAQGMQAPRSARQGGTRRLSREEAHMAERMGMSLREYAQAKDLGDVEI